MSDLSALNPQGRFSGLADNYARHRPGYPAEAIDHLLRHLGLSGGSLLVDVGCGTGISSRLVAARGVPVVGVEPNDDMRAQVQREPAPPGGPAPTFRRASAEATGLPDGCADAVLVAQAFHWFEPDAALREFRRILKPGGRVALLWNERDEGDPFTRAYGDVLRTVPRVAAEERRRQEAGRVLWATPHFVQPEEVAFVNEQELGEEGLLGRAFSVSYLPREGPAREAVERGLREAFVRFASDGRVRLRYRTPIQSALRAE